MENNRKEKLEELINTVAELKARVEALEHEVEEYRALLEADNDVADVVEMEIAHEDFLQGISEVAAEPGPAAVPDEPGTDIPAAGDDLPETFPEEDIPAEDIPVEEVPAGDIPEDLPEDSDPGSLFGEFLMEPAPQKLRPSSRQKSLNEANAGRAAGAVIDIKASNPAWLKDMPGPEVKDVRSAISLNDRVMFISTLFREDSMLFQDVVGHINNMSSLDKAVAYLQETFPEWDMTSDAVYRFMMAVRRKIR
ncbi:MAG: hypothetical protein ACI3ZC_07435 [Candidatus Cryptobacteroides sp.]